jgi:hypothetical protein
MSALGWRSSSPPGARPWSCPYGSGLRRCYTGRFGVVEPPGETAAGASALEVASPAGSSASIGGPWPGRGAARRAARRSALARALSFSFISRSRFANAGRWVAMCYSLPWLDGRRSIVPPEAARGGGCSARFLAALALVETAPRTYHDRRRFTIKTAGCPDLAHIRRFVDLSLDTWRRPRHIAHSVTRSNGLTILGPAWDHERRRHRWQKVRSSV